MFVLKTVSENVAAFQQTSSTSKISFSQTLMETLTCWTDRDQKEHWSSYQIYKKQTRKQTRWSTSGLLVCDGLTVRFNMVILILTFWFFYVVFWKDACTLEKVLRKKKKSLGPLQQGKLFGFIDFFSVKHFDDDNDVFFNNCSCIHEMYWCYDCLQASQYNVLHFGCKVFSLSFVALYDTNYILPFSTNAYYSNCTHTIL